MYKTEDIFNAKIMPKLTNLALIRQKNVFHSFDKYYVSFLLKP